MKIKKCVVCGKRFMDTENHAYIDERHSEYAERLSREWETLPCFCGGKLRLYQGNSPDGFVLACEKCNFLALED